MGNNTSSAAPTRTAASSSAHLTSEAVLIEANFKRLSVDGATVTDEAFEACFGANELSAAILLHHRPLVRTAHSAAIVNAAAMGAW